MGVHVSPILNPLSPPSPSHSSGSYQCTGLECPVSCIEPGLAIYFTYGNIHVSMLFFQIIPPSPPPTESKNLFFIFLSLLPKVYSLSFCLFCCLAYRVIFLNSIYMRQYTVLVFFFLTYFTLYNRLQFHPPH